MPSPQIGQGIAFTSTGSAAGVPVVLGHALGADRQVWNEVAAALEPHHCVIRWEHPGHGDSPLAEAPLEISTVAESVLKGLSELGVERFHLAGISLGGMVALAMAAQAPERVASLAVLDAGPSLPPAQTWIDRAAQVRRLGMASLVDGTMERWFTPEFAASAEGHRRTRASFLACDPEGYARCCEMISRTDLTAILGGITLPTLLLAGRDDPGMTPAQLEILAGQIPGARARYVVVEDARHLTCVEQAEIVTKALTENFRNQHAL